MIGSRRERQLEEIQLHNDCEGRVLGKQPAEAG